MKSHHAILLGLLVATNGIAQSLPNHVADNRGNFRTVDDGGCWDAPSDRIGRRSEWLTNGILGVVYTNDCDRGIYLTIAMRQVLANKIAV